MSTTTQDDAWPNRNGAESGTASPRGRKSPVENFEGIHKGPGFSTWRKGTHADLIRQAEAMNNAANYLKSCIIKSSNWPWGVNKRLAARKITRPLFKASELLYASASCMVIAGREYNAAFTKEAPKRGDFDPKGA
jgi:hypothetical protein